MWDMPCLFNFLLNHLYQYELTDINFLLWFIIQYYVILLLKLFQFLAFGISVTWLLYPFDIVPLFYFIYLVLVHSFFFFFLGPHPQYMKVPRLWGRISPMPQPQQHRIWAMSVTYTTACGKVGSLTHWARPGIEPVSSWLLVRSVNCWALTGTPWTTLFFSTIGCYIIPILVLKSVISLRSPGSFYWKRVLETKIWLLGNLIATWVLLLWGSLGCLSKETYVYSNQLSITISICDYVSMKPNMNSYLCLQF